MEANPVQHAVSVDNHQPGEQHSEGQAVQSVGAVATATGADRHPDRLWRSSHPGQAFISKVPPIVLKEPVNLSLIALRANQIRGASDVAAAAASVAASASPSAAAAAAPLQLRYLADHPEHIPAIAQALWKEWGECFDQYDHMHDVQTVERWIREECCETMQLGCTIIGLQDGELVGCAMLCPEDSDSAHPYYGAVPWASYNVVLDAWRGRGYSRVICGALCGLARSWGYAHIWAVADGPLVEMYTKAGARIIDQVDFWGESATVLRLDFAPDASVPAPKGSPSVAAAVAAAGK